MAKYHQISNNSTNQPTNTSVYSLYLINSSVVSLETTLIGNNQENKSSSCSIFKDVGVNDLSINDVVVKSQASNTACIKARFSLAIKVEALLENNNNKQEGDSTPQSVEQSTITLGYLPLDSVINVEDSCPNEQTVQEDDTNSQDGSVKDNTESNELDMIVSFECGKLAFSFRKEEYFYLYSIRGMVNLDSNTMREFISEKPMFFTSDLSHHFLFNDLIEVSSTAKTKAFILTANFYNSEFEVFRNTSSRDFIRPPDEKSKPFLLN